MKMGYKVVYVAYRLNESGHIDEYHRASWNSLEEAIDALNSEYLQGDILLLPTAQYTYLEEE